VAKAVPHEPDAAEVVARSERLRREGYRDAVAILADWFGLRDGLDIDRATDLLLMFGSSATYLTLRRYGWSDDNYVAWATDTLSKQLLARPGRTPRGEPLRRLGVRHHRYRCRYSRKAALGAQAQ
jgi:hypothetical protein